MVLSFIGWFTDPVHCHLNRRWTHESNKPPDSAASCLQKIEVSSNKRGMLLKILSTLASVYVKIRNLKQSKKPPQAKKQKHKVFLDQTAGGTVRWGVPEKLNTFNFETDH